MTWYGSLGQLSYPCQWRLSAGDFELSQRNREIFEVH